MKIQLILDSYQITPATCALLPTRSLDHQTKVIEEEQILYVKQSPFDVIKHNCLLNGADYAGRINAITYHLHFKRKVPVAIHPTIHAFPTHRVNSFECIWLFAKQITRTQAKNNHSKIVFKNNTTLKLPISNHILTKQSMRCAEVANLYKQIKPTSNHPIQ